MAGRPPKSPILVTDLEGFKYFEMIRPLLESLREEGTQRDTAGNREFFYDNLVALLLLYFFNPIFTSLRSLQQATELEKVQKVIGCSKVSLGSLSEAQGIFAPSLLEGIIAELVQRVTPTGSPRDKQALENLVAVDGSLLPACSRMAWALWLDAKNRAAKMHLHFEVLRGIPIAVEVTQGNGSETQKMREMLAADRLYVMDRGYAEYQLLQDIVDAGSSFIVRIRDNAVWKVVKERPLTEEDRAAGVVREMEVWLGGEKSGQAFDQTVRVVEVGVETRDGENETLLLATDRMDLSADLVALGYRFRWSVELFFRWYKTILARRRLLLESPEGVTIQVYVAIIASLLLSLWTGKKPTKRTYEMFCLFFAGWATEDELVAHLKKLKTASPDTG